MITLRKLSSLKQETRLRKIVRIMTAVERDLHDHGSSDVDTVYLRRIGELVQEELQIPDEARSAGARLAAACSSIESSGRKLPAESDAAALTIREELLRSVNNLRHVLSACTGNEAAEWDLIVRAGDGGLQRPALPVTLFLEDIRSPFNVGSIIRTAAAFGVERVILSPATARADHPRALRSAMGAYDYVSVERMDLVAAASDGANVLALEQGGCPIDEYRFPADGLVIVGSEELGVSPAALELAERRSGRVTIPLSGRKASLNVGVAVGILLAAWQSCYSVTIS